MFPQTGDLARSDRTADHYAAEQRCEILLDQLKRANTAELEMLEVTTDATG